MTLPITDLGEYFILRKRPLVFDGPLEVLPCHDAVEEVLGAVRRHSAPGVPVEHGEPAHLRRPRLSVSLTVFVAATVNGFNCKFKISQAMISASSTAIWVSILLLAKN